MTHIISDFKEGDRVYHLSRKQFSTKTEMIVTVINHKSINNHDSIKCSWISDEGLSQKEDFFPFELEKIR